MILIHRRQASMHPRNAYFDRLFFAKLVLD